MTPKPVSLDALREVGIDPPAESTKSWVYLPVDLRSLVADCDRDPEWAPTPDQVPLTSTDISHLVDLFTDHDDADGVSGVGLLLLAQRVALRNQALAAEVLQKFTSNGVTLDDFLGAANAAVDAWAHTHKAKGYVAQLQAYLELARRVGLTPAQAAAFGRFPAGLVVEACSDRRTRSVWESLRDQPTAAYREMARQHGIDESAVRRVVARWGDPHRETRLTAEPDSYARIRELRADGWSYKRIQAEVGVGAATVKRALDAEVAA